MIMIYNDKLWQSINETNKESVLTILQVRSLLAIQITLLTKKLSVLTLLLYKTPSGCCMSFASQVRVTTEHYSQNAGYLCHKF